MARKILGVTTAGSSDIVSKSFLDSGTTTLTNKTLTSPKIGTTILDTNGNNVLAISAIGSAVNYLTLNNNTAGSSPALSANGTDANLSVYLQGKGVGGAALAGSASERILLTETVGASAVNYIYITNSLTTNSPVVQAIGADTNIDLSLTAKGSGKVKAGGIEVTTISGAQTLTSKTLTSPVINSPTGIVKGDVGLGNVDNTSDATKNAASVTLTNKTLTDPRISTLRDANGNITLDFAATTSAVNYLYFRNAATGSSPEFDATGSDTNIDITFATKGTGRILIDVASGQTPTIRASSVSTNVNLNLQPKGTGVVQANGIEVATISTTQTLTNKTLTSPAINTPTGIVKGDVGLGNVDNTSDATKNSATATLTNKWVQPRTVTTTSTATPTIDVTITDHYTITALAANISSFSATGTAVDGQKLLIRIKDNGTARTITWDSAKFVSSGVAPLLATTVISKTHYIGCVYDGVLGKFVCIAVDATGY